MQTGSLDFLQSDWRWDQLGEHIGGINTVSILGKCFRKGIDDNSGMLCIGRSFSGRLGLVGRHQCLFLFN